MRVERSVLREGMEWKGNSVSYQTMEDKSRRETDT